MRQRSMYTDLAWLMLMPLVPRVVPAPLMSRLRSTILSVVSALMTTPCTPEERMLPSSSEQSMVIDFVIVTGPKPPASRQLMMPPAAVFEMAPANVLQGAVRLHGLTSSPTPDTHVRVAWAWASAGTARAKIQATTIFLMRDPPSPVGAQVLPRDTPWELGRTVEQPGRWYWE